VTVPGRETAVDVRLEERRHRRIEGVNTAVGRPWLSRSKSADAADSRWLPGSKSADTAGSRE
jgi:hypothetical protein